DVLVVVGTYTVTQEDVENGSLVNIASVTGVDGDGNMADDEDDVVIEAIQNYELSLTKENEINDEQGITIKQFSSVNDQIYYTITTKNTGNMILYNVIVEDIMIDVLIDVEYIHLDASNQVIKTYTSEDIEPVVLMPNEQLVMNATYQVVAKDLVNGNIINLAKATYEDEGGEVLGESDDFTESYGFTQLTILKVDDKDSTKILEGAEFELTNVATKQKWTVITDSNGIASFKNLLFGEYELRETKSPEGYALSTDEIVIVINEENNTDINLTITNKEILADMSDVSYQLSASVLMLLGVLLLLLSKKKQTA
ncbi:MAG: prealbumin-like fold domain-containing protein, partial [Acholeplasmataceae bacterium]|nr:prealbumin-like fold domain-containing protein [Acholeplasmataceae bacterium]